MWVLISLINLKYKKRILVEVERGGVVPGERAMLVETGEISYRVASREAYCVG